MKLAGKWKMVRQIFNEAFASSMHYALATVNEDGTPHVAPIGSVLLTEEGAGLYFEVFAAQTPKNLQINPRVCILAVNSGRLFWLSALLAGRFDAPPAV